MRDSALAIRAVHFHSLYASVDAAFCKLRHHTLLESDPDELCLWDTKQELTETKAWPRSARAAAGYNVSGARTRASSLKVFAMWYAWLLLVSCALVQAEIDGETGPVTERTGHVTEVTSHDSDFTGPVGGVTESELEAVKGPEEPRKEQDPGASPQNEIGDIKEVPSSFITATGTVTEIPLPVATTRTPPRTLDRQAAELAWRYWLQSPESGNPNGPARRITTKSLFITPLVCPKGQRLDRNGCVQTLTVNKDEHERILLEQLNALFINSTPSNNADVLYDYGEEEPGPLQLTIPIGLDPQIHQSIDKKGDNAMLNDASIEAELELLKLQQNAHRNETTSDTSNILSHNVLNLLNYPDKPKRDSPMENSTETEIQDIPDKGQKEEVFGQVNVDPVLYDTNNQDEQIADTEKPLTEKVTIKNNETYPTSHENTNKMSDESLTRKDAANTKLNPENDYSDIGEAIRLISRYAEVSTDDNFPKSNKLRNPDDNILGTRTKMQYRRNKPKLSNNQKDMSSVLEPQNVEESNVGASLRGRPGIYYRYPNDNISPPPNYPFKRLQDYWPGRNQIGGVYNNMHENPKRHHHSYPHYFRPRGYPVLNYPEVHSRMSPLYRYPNKVQHNTSPVRSHDGQDIYNLLGLRHWFSSEGATKR
ncbi:unnamed protein product [Leptosia nina]|uniref:Folded gastrulation N-terminal domain-containing protein n=1 Tax=Leptosia nina TaxID=320188 RepID=A0AAV1JED8_9NEOP